MKRKLILLISILLAAVITLSVFVFAAYDSSNDPLITFSYLESYVEQMIRPIREKIANIEGTVASPEKYTSICLSPGQMLQCTASTELILRVGSAVIVSPFTNQGLSDITAGVDLLNGTDVPKNHCLIIPRGNDGRGILITGPYDAHIMVGGAYTIVG